MLTIIIYSKNGSSSGLVVDILDNIIAGISTIIFYYNNDNNIKFFLMNPCVLKLLATVNNEQFHFVSEEEKERKRTRTKSEEKKKQM